MNSPVSPGVNGEHETPVSIGVSGGHEGSCVYRCEKCTKAPALPTVSLHSPGPQETDSHFLGWLLPLELA